MRRLLMIGLAIFAIALPSGISLAAKADKVDVCHLNGNGSYVLISVSGNGWNGHSGHTGDFAAVDGSCEVDGDG